MKRRTLVLLGLLVAVVLTGGVSYYASSSPDGLNKVSADKGFADRASEHGLADSPVADYSTPRVDDERLSGGIAGVLGVLATFALGGVVFAVVRRRTPAEPPSTEIPAGR